MKVSGSDRGAAGLAQPLSHALRAMRPALWAVGLFSLALNILMLTGPIFMLQVYDRVLTSQSVPTLVALFSLVCVLYLFFAVFDMCRSRVLSRIGYWLDDRLARPAFRVALMSRLSGHGTVSRPLVDLTAIRGLFSGQGLPAVFDLPWVPIYIAIVFALHVTLGLLALLGAAVVVGVALLNEWATRAAIRESTRWENQETQFAEQSWRNAETVVSLGMSGHVARQWQGLRDEAKARAQLGGERSEGLASFSKAFRLLVQSALLALGGYLAIHSEISPGTIVAASILAGRALAPIDQTIGNWRMIVRARQAYGRLRDALQADDDQTVAPTSLPAPEGHLEVDRVLKLAPASPTNLTGARRPILQGFQFALKPGDALGVIGPSAAGKSTLARLLVGLTLPDQGAVRLDGASFDQWDRDRLGRHIGYLPQAVEFLPGSLKQNIARFDPEARDEDVIAAARLAGAHDLIVRMPEGYATDIGSGRAPLSGGQAQRIALARAVYRLPTLVVLDEPSSNLDVDGDAALARAIGALRNAGSVIVVMSHRPATIAAANLVLMIKDGRQAEFGPRDTVLRKVTRWPPGPRKEALSTGNRIVVGAGAESAQERASENRAGVHHERAEQPAPIGED